MLEAKGRNGYFKLDRVRVFHLGHVVAKPEGKIHVDFFSKRGAENTGPVHVEGTPEEIRNLFHKITRMIDREIKGKGEIVSLTATLEDIARVSEGEEE